MKVGAFILLCLSVLTSLCSDGQDTNKTAEVLGKAQGNFEEGDIDLKMDMPEGLGSVRMVEAPRLYIVRLPVELPVAGTSFLNHPAPDVSSLGLQVWLLQPDGTTFPQFRKPSLTGIAFAGRESYSMLYTFTRLPSIELAGIIVQVKGKLYCREITKSMIEAAYTPLNALCRRWQSEHGDNYEFFSDGKYVHWQQAPLVAKSAQAENVNASSRIGVSKGRFLVDDHSLVLIQKNGASETNICYITQTMFGSSMDLTLPDGSIKGYWH